MYADYNWNQRKFWGAKKLTVSKPLAGCYCPMWLFLHLHSWYHVTSQCSSVTLHCKGCVVSYRPQLICHVSTNKSYVHVCDLLICHSRSVLLPQRLCVCVCVCRMRTGISFLTLSFMINSQICHYVKWVMIKLPLCQQFNSWLVLQWVMCGLGEILD